MKTSKSRCFSATAAALLLLEVSLLLLLSSIGLVRGECTELTSGRQHDQWTPPCLSTRDLKGSSKGNTNQKKKGGVKTRTRSRLAACRKKCNQSRKKYVSKCSKRCTRKGKGLSCSSLCVRTGKTRKRSCLKPCNRKKPAIVCTKIKDLVECNRIGKKKRKFPNMCVAKKNGYKKQDCKKLEEKSKTTPVPGCPKTKLLVRCGDDKKEFPNLCLAERAGFDESQCWSLDSTQEPTEQPTYTPQPSTASPTDEDTDQSTLRFFF